MGLGIDFGTTRTVVAWADRGNYPVVSFEDAAGDTFDGFPSVVAVRGDEVRYGFDALAASDADGFTRARSFKRLLGDADARPDGVVELGGRARPVLGLVTGFLRALRQALETRSNVPKALLDGAPVVVATPAHAFCTQRFLTLDAFRAAGFAVTSMLNEPSAAGFEYAHRHARTLTSKRDHVLVYDLGGGTFDASLVRMTGAEHEVVATAGLPRLGGDDFDEVLARLAAEAAGRPFEGLPTAARARLLDQARELKEKLQPATKRLVFDLETSLGALAPRAEVAVTVAQFQEAAAPLVERTLVALAPLAARLDAEAGGGPGEASAAGDDGASEVALGADVAGLYVVGGASALPLVGRVLRARFGRRVHRSPHPHGAIAIGLALAADTRSALRLTDRFSRTFGVFREGDSGARAVADPIFTRETRLPRPGEPALAVARRYRAAHDVGHFRFFECTALGEAGQPDGEVAPQRDVRFAFDPALRAPDVDLAARGVRRIAGEGPLVEERYEVDAAGLVRVTITDLERAYSASHVLGGDR